MYITKLELNNFQKHSSLTLDFVDGVNVISGDTDAGKSCIRRAISWLIYGEPKGNDVRKEDTKKTSVKATFNTGLVLERIKSATVNAYVITVNGEEKKYDSIGTSVPLEVNELLNMRPIEVDGDSINLNLAEQLTLPFLFDKTAGFRLKLFNNLTGNDIIDKVFQDYNKDLLSISKEIKFLTDTRTSTEVKLEIEKTNWDILRTKKTDLENEITKLEEFEKRIEQLKSKKLEYDNVIKVIKEYEVGLSNFKDMDTSEIDNLKLNLEELKKYEDLRIRHCKAGVVLQTEKQILERTKTINFDFKKYFDFVLLKEKCSSLLKKLNLVNSSKANNSKNIEELDKKLTDWKANYKKLLIEAKVCPTCKCTIDEEHLKDLHI